MEPVEGCLAGDGCGEGSVGCVGVGGAAFAATTSVGLNDVRSFNRESRSKSSTGGGGLLASISYRE